MANGTAPQTLTPMLKSRPAVRLTRSPMRPVIQGPGPTPSKLVTSRVSATAEDRARGGASSCTAAKSGPKYALAEAAEKNQQT